MMMNREWIESLPKTPPETENEHEHEHGVQKQEEEENINTFNTFSILQSKNIKYVYNDIHPSDNNDDDDDDVDDEEVIIGDGDDEEYYQYNNNNNNKEDDDNDDNDNDEYDDEYEYDEDEESYGSDNDDINSDDQLYDVINMDESININLSRIEIDRFHKYLYGYYDCTRSSKRLCQSRYDILCLINDIWQKVLIQREFHKNNICTDPHDKKGGNIVIECIYNTDSYYYEPYKLDINSNEWITPCSSPEKRIKLVHKTGNIIYNKIIPSAKIFGSIRTRLDCEGSDMDIMLPNSVDNPIIDTWFNKNEQKAKLTQFLNILNKRISDNNDEIMEYKGCKYKFEIFPILNAKVPIIKIKEILTTGLEMDIAIQSSQESVSKLINFYCDYDDRVRPFIISIKHWSKIRQLCDAMNNYPNSFGFVLLSIKYLQMINILPICCIQQEIDDININKITMIQDIDRNNLNTDTLLELMVQFFEMYHRFNFKLLQISTSRIGLESKICHEYYSTFKYQHQTTMVVEDPSCRSVNVTRNVRPYRLSIMQNEFFRAYKATKYGDWQFLMTKYINNSKDIPFFNIYPPSDQEQQFLYKQNLQEMEKEKDDENNDNDNDNDDDEEEEEENEEEQHQFDDAEDDDNDHNYDENGYYDDDDDGNEEEGDNEDNGNEKEEEEYEEYEEEEEEQVNNQQFDEQYNEHYNEDYDEEFDGRYDDADYDENNNDNLQKEGNEGKNNKNNKNNKNANDYNKENEENENEMIEEIVHMTQVIDPSLYVITKLGGGGRRGRGRGRGRGRAIAIDSNKSSPNYILGRIHNVTQTPNSSLSSTANYVLDDIQNQQQAVIINNGYYDDDDDDEDDDNHNDGNMDDTVFRNKLNIILCDNDILSFWKINPFKTQLFESLVMNVDQFNVEYINLYLDNYSIDMIEFIRISKYYLIQFNIQFLRYYQCEKQENMHLNDVFDILNYEDISELHHSLKYKKKKEKEGIKFQIKFLEEINKFNNDYYYKIFLREIEKQQFIQNKVNNNNNNNKGIMPYNLMIEINNKFIDTSNNNNILLTIYNYSYYISFISLYGFWKCLFDDIDDTAISTTNRDLSVSRLLNKKWIISKIKNAMIAIGLKYLSQTKLFKLLK